MAGFQNVLIVEDEVMIRELYFITLTKAGYKVECTGDGPATFDLLLHFRPDIIFLDIMLPGMSGIDILKKLRADPQYNCQNTKIILITNLGQENLADVALASHADGYVIKADIVPKDLIKIIRSLEQPSPPPADTPPPAPKDPSTPAGAP
ncbi:MAG TPA: response regulator [Candidatus Saccharimonadales bacterium]|jgi:CheY-like chemotaxis protein|nr:response regulator [Candidatus Saccharimonadales bacterium]